jgi:hypothetical protein
MTPCGLMERIGGYGHQSRDWQLPTIDCRRTDCTCNSGHGQCLIPSRCKLSESGTCEGYERHVPALRLDEWRAIGDE